METGEPYTWEQIGIKPQLCIWLTPWSELFRGTFQLFEYSLDVVHTYIPYCFMIPNNERGNFVFDQYNQFLHNMTWKNFEESKFAVEMAVKYSFIGGENAVYTGYPKMDAFYKRKADGESIWEVLTQKSGNDKAKRIIYAPHHTLGEDEPIHFSTFASNYMLMLQLAEKYQEETVWIFKPHPHLKYKAVREGIFRDMEEWYAYEQRWRELKNTQVMEAGLYHALFTGSDAMILDSVSFLAEYLYVNKPLLMLKRREQFYNDFGEQLIKVHYSAEGTDLTAIENFIVEVVLKHKDEKKVERKRFFEENLDYVQEFGKSAAANIYEQIKKALLS